MRSEEEFQPEIEHLGIKSGLVKTGWCRQERRGDRSIEYLNIEVAIDLISGPDGVEQHEKRIPHIEADAIRQVDGQVEGYLGKYGSPHGIVNADVGRLRIQSLPCDGHNSG